MGGELIFSSPLEGEFPAGKSSKPSLVNYNAPEAWQLVGAVADGLLLMTGYKKMDAYEIIMGATGLVGQGVNYAFRNSPHKDLVQNITNPLIALSAAGLVYDGHVTQDGFKELAGGPVATAFTLMVPPVARLMKRIFPEKHLFIPQAFLLASTGAMAALGVDSHSTALIYGAGLYLWSNLLMPHSDHPSPDVNKSDLSTLRRPSQISTSEPR